LRVIDVLNPLGHFAHLFKMSMDTSQNQDSHNMKVLATMTDLKYFNINYYMEFTEGGYMGNDMSKYTQALMKME